MTTLSLNPSQFHLPQSFGSEGNIVFALRALGLFAPNPAALRRPLGGNTQNLKQSLYINWGFIASLLMHGILAVLLVKAVFPVEEPPLTPVQVITLVEQRPVVSKQSSIVSKVQKPATSHQSQAFHKVQGAKHKVPQKPVVSRQSSFVSKASDIRPQTSSQQTTRQQPLATHQAQGTKHKAPSSYSPASFDAAYLRNPAPEYPAAAKRRRMQGTVLLSVTVSSSGDALVVRLKKSSGFAPLDMAAENAVKRWQFVPAKRGGTPVTAQVVVPVEFRLAS